MVENNADLDFFVFLLDMFVVFFNRKMKPRDANLKIPSPLNDISVFNYFEFSPMINLP